MDKLFQNALSEQTFKYLQTQTQLIQNQNDLSNVDLRVLTSQVQKDLQEVQNDSALDYLKVEKEIYEMSECLDKSDKILENLEGMLSKFQNNLNFIKDDMTNLQQRSNEMNVSLKNRKQLSQKVGGFIEHAILEPELINDICNRDIDEKYIESINQLKQKLQYLQEIQIQYPNSALIQELEPELVKLNKKACQRVRAFLIEKIKMLQTPKTNICVVQNNVLSQFNILLTYLRTDFPIEICNLYAKIVGKIYLQNFKLYSQELLKFSLPTVLKNDLIISEQDNYERQPFKFVNQDHVLSQMNETPIICQVARQSKFEFPLEQIFRSLNKFLVDNVQGEFYFTLQFFGLRLDQNILFFGGLLKQTLNLALETIKTMINQCYDIYSLLLISMINQQSKTQHQAKNQIKIFDHYFEQIDILIWPRVNLLFDSQHKILQQQCSHQKYLNPNFITIRINTHHFQDSLQNHRLLFWFAKDLQIVQPIEQNALFENGQMLKLVIMKNTYFELISKSSANLEELPKLKYIIIIYDLIQQGFYQDFLEANFEQEMNQNIEKLVELYITNYFQHLVSFCKKYFFKSRYGIDSQSSIDSQVIKQEVNLQLIENLGNQINENWSSQITAIGQDLNKAFKNNSCLNIIVKKFLSQFLNYYSTFFKYTKENHDSFHSKLLPVHIFMKEIKEILKQFFK